MLPADRLAINTFDKASLQLGRSLGLGLEVVDYLLTDADEDIIAKRKSVSELISWFSRLSFHGQYVSMSATRDAVHLSAWTNGPAYWANASGTCTFTTTTVGKTNIGRLGRAF